MRQALVRRTTGDIAGALALLEQAIAKNQFPFPGYYSLGADLSLRRGKFDQARDYLERACPTLARPQPVFDDFGGCSTPAYATALRGLGRDERAQQVLQAYLEYIAARPRLGIKGYGIADAEALALLGRRDEALSRLRAAVDAGWRTAWGRNGWNLADDPYLTAIHEDARFRAIQAEVEADVGRMRERSMQAESTQDWQPLLALAAQGTGRGAPTSAK
jgi:tetratricopeptide (TPR) repeat protein